MRLNYTHKNIITMLLINLTISSLFKYIYKASYMKHTLKFDEN
jgi:hypothetical protein